MYMYIQGFVLFYEQHNHVKCVIRHCCSQDMQGQTALHHSLASQRTRAIPILLTAGADLTLLNANLFSPLLEAAGFGFLPYVSCTITFLQ